MASVKKMLLLLCTCFWSVTPASAQFIDHFNGPLAKDPKGLQGWGFLTGDGTATMDFRQGDGFATITVDATSDRQNIWWALIKRNVAPNLNLKRLNQPNYELRVEARVRASHAPRRVNLHVNTQRTTDFHSHLMEYEIGDTVNWHTISMTTKGFDAKPGDVVNAQMALMDWGLEQYQVDIDYFRVDVVNTKTAGPDQGVQLRYHPPIPPLMTYTHQVPVAQDAMIDLRHPDLNFNRWSVTDKAGETPLLTVSGDQYVIMRWDLSAFRGKEVTQAGLLELTTHSLQRSPAYQKDFGMIRVVEILGGDPDWRQEEVTLDSFSQGRPLNRVLNTQMIIDVEVARGDGSTNLITISQPVLQRLLNGTSKGIAILPLGAVVASFYAGENGKEAFRPKLHLRSEADGKKPSSRK